MSAAADDREIPFNGNFDAASPATLYGRDWQNSAGLAWYYFGGRYASGSIANGNTTVTDNATTYKVAARSNGAVSFSTSITNWNDSTNYFRLYKIVAASGVVTYEDHREPYGWQNAASLSREIQFAGSDLVTPITTGLVGSFRAPRAMTIQGVKAALDTSQTSGSVLTIDIKENGTTILSTLLTFDNTEETTTTATTPAVVSDTSIGADSKLTAHVTQVGDGTAIGLSVTLIYT